MAAQVAATGALQAVAMVTVAVAMDYIARNTAAKAMVNGTTMLGGCLLVAVDIQKEAAETKMGTLQAAMAAEAEVDLESRTRLASTDCIRHTSPRAMHTSLSMAWHALRTSFHTAIVALEAVAAAVAMVTVTVALD